MRVNKGTLIFIAILGDFRIKQTTPELSCSIEDFSVLFCGE
jgi:hypothetical protein